MSNAYNIRQLKCQYPKSPHPVLYIEELDLPKGKMIFIVGASGVGKSTILETLGLMNNTAKPDEKTQFSFQGANQENVNLNTIWSKGERVLADFRKQHLSFIFQDMNLFFHLSMYQNACLPNILQGSREEEAIKGSNRLFRKILPDIMVSNQPEDRPVVNMSGGQRQRLAFIRALNAQYSVLFADEPTGNLDYANAKRLMDILAEDEKAKSATRVIVSHDINLALDYADEVVLISKGSVDGEEVEMGVINKSSKYVRKGDVWTNGSSEMKRKDLRDVLRNALVHQAISK